MSDPNSLCQPIRPIEAARRTVSLRSWASKTTTKKWSSREKEFLFSSLTLVCGRVTQCGTHLRLLPQKRPYLRPLYKVRAASTAVCTDTDPCHHHCVVCRRRVKHVRRSLRRMYGKMRHKNHATFLHTFW